jgi:hypothetical protein
MMLFKIYPLLTLTLLGVTRSSNIVSTSECDEIRTTPFVAKLELEYLYLVESIVPLQDLRGLQNVNNRAILDALGRCNNQSAPEYAIDLEINHDDVEQGMLCFNSYVNPTSLALFRDLSSPSLFSNQDTVFHRT